ncbi:hypothetical protein ACWEVD_00675 [Nocardia thailandica]
MSQNPRKQADVTVKQLREALAMLPDEMDHLPVVLRTPILEDLGGGTVLVDVWTPGLPRIGSPAPGVPDAVVLDGTRLHLSEQP